MISSAYWTTLLDAGFSETENGERKSTADDQASDNGDDHDSDRESDLVSIEGVSVRGTSSISAGVKEVVVKKAAYTTYRAVLTWIVSRRIKFTKLDKQPPRTKKRTANGKFAKTKALEQPADVPLAVSPKSVYKLAHLLEIAELEKLAVAEIKSQLTSENVLRHLTSEISAYEPVRQALLDFALAHWDEVRKTDAMKRLEDVNVLEALPNPFLVAATMCTLAARLSHR